MNGSLYHLFSRCLSSYPDRRWLIYKSDSYSFFEIEERVNRLANHMAELGLRSGDRVAIYMAKTPEMVVALLACSRLALVSVPIHSVLKALQLNYILRDSSAAAIMVDAVRQSYIESHLDSGYIRQLICFGATDSQDGFISVPVSNSLACESLPEKFLQAELLIYTSGSTGKPKGVVVSRSNVSLGAESVAEYLGLSPEDRVLSLLPFAFDYGFNQLSSSLSSGAQLVLMDFMLAADVVRQVKLHKITVVAGVPPLWVKLLRADWQQGAGQSLRLLTNSGGRLPFAVQESLLSIFPNAELVLMYGLTEAFRSTYLPAELRRDNPDAIGQPIPGAELYILNEQGHEVEENELGELVHCGPLVTLGYWGNTQQSTLRFREPPEQVQLQSESGKAVWTGDQVYRGENGLLYFVGREDGLIKSSGYRISPEEVEEAAYSVAGIKEAVVFGVDDQELGQRLVMVVSKEKSDLTEEVIRQKMRTLLPEYMVPHRIVFDRELLRTPSGKFDRVAIKAGHHE